jgi:hypothetical protein
MKVQIKVYEHELESVLDRIQAWGSNYEWADTGPNFYIELNVLPSHYTDALTDRFADVDHPTVSSKETISDIISKYKASNTRPSAHEQMEQLRQLLRGE